MTNLKSTSHKPSINQTTHKTFILNRHVRPSSAHSAPPLPPSTSSSPIHHHYRDAASPFPRIPFWGDCGLYTANACDRWRVAKQKLFLSGSGEGQVGSWAWVGFAQLSSEPLLWPVISSGHLLISWRSAAPWASFPVVVGSAWSLFKTLPYLGNLSVFTLTGTISAEYKFLKIQNWSWGCSSAVEHLPSVCKALSLSPNSQTNRHTHLPPQGYVMLTRERGERSCVSLFRFQLASKGMSFINLWTWQFLKE